MAGCVGATGRHPERGARRRRQVGPQAPRTARAGAVGPGCAARPTRLEIITTQSASRLAPLIPIRHARMAVSPWTYYRGAAAVMAADLASGPNTGHPGADVRRRPRPQLRPVGHAGAQPAVRPARLRRDAPRAVRVGRQAPARQHRRARRRQRPAPPDDADAVVAASPATARAWPATPRRPSWRSGTPASTSTACSASSSRRTGPGSARSSSTQARKRTSQGALDKLTEVRDGGGGSARTRRSAWPSTRSWPPSCRAVVYDSYRDSLPEHLHHLLDRFHFVDAVRQIVGVGSVGMQVYLVLARRPQRRRRPAVPADQAGRTVGLRALPRPDAAASHGERVIHGKRLLQTATDIFAGLDVGRGRDFYVRQFRDMKVIPDSRADRPAPRASSPRPAARCSPGPTPAAATPRRSTATSAAATRSPSRSPAVRLQLRRAERHRPRPARRRGGRRGRGQQPGLLTLRTGGATPSTGQGARSSSTNVGPVPSATGCPVVASTNVNGRSGAGRDQTTGTATPLRARRRCRRRP